MRPAAVANLALLGVSVLALTRRIHPADLLLALLSRTCTDAQSGPGIARATEPLDQAEAVALLPPPTAPGRSHNLAVLGAKSRVRSTRAHVCAG